MRKLIFRGKRLDNNKWVQGKLVEIGVAPGIQPGTNKHEAVPVVESTVGQYIGFDDSEGVPIYEDDIVRFMDPADFDTEVEAIVYYLDDVGGFYLSRYSFEEVFAKDRWVEVIGNIYDSPELVQSIDDKTYGISDKQRKVIGYIEDNLKIKFTGKTPEAAWRWTLEHMEESKKYRDQLKKQLEKQEEILALCNTGLIGEG